MFQLVFERQLPLDLRSVRAARLALLDIARSWTDSTLRDDAELVVSELVANAVSHAVSVGSCPVTLRLLADVGRVRIEVDDGDPEPPAPRLAPPDAERGRGLQIVAALCPRYGVVPRITGKCVWAELGPSRAKAPALETVPAGPAC